MVNPVGIGLTTKVLGFWVYAYLVAGVPRGGGIIKRGDGGDVPALRGHLGRGSGSFFKWIRGAGLKVLRRASGSHACWNCNSHTGSFDGTSKEYSLSLSRSLSLSLSLPVSLPVSLSISDI